MACRLYIGYSFAVPSLAELYDRYSARLFAVALRIVGDRDVACNVIEEVFLEADPNATEAALIRLTREQALARAKRDDIAVPPGQATPRLLVEEAFYGGRDVRELSARYAMPEQVVRSMLRDGMAQLRQEFAGEVRR
jgi:DNA-directed RNA polymerase specialized sigma24 family protein